MAYIGVTLRILDTFVGSAPSDEISLEFFVPGTARDADAAVAELTESMPGGEMVIFLREKRGPGEAGLYRLVSSRGLWVDSGGRVEAPLSHDAETLYATEFSAVDTVDAIAVLLRRA